MMKVITEKQTPITPAQSNASVNNDVMNMLANMLFASLYVQVNSQPNTPQQTQMSSNQVSGDNDEAASSLTTTSDATGQSEALATPAALLIDQLLQSTLLVPTTAKNSNTDEIARESAQLSAATEVQQPMPSTPLTTSTPSDQKARAILDKNSLMDDSLQLSSEATTESQAGQTLKQDALKQIDKTEQTTKQDAQPHLEKLPFVNKDTLQNKTLPATDMKKVQTSLPNTNQTPSTIHHVQKPFEEWIADINDTQVAQSTQPQVPAATVVMATGSDPSLTSSAKSGKETNIVSQPGSDTPMVFHFEKCEPVVGQHDVYEMIIRVTPQELGPVHAKLKMNKNSVEIVIMTNNSHAEQAIKAHLPQLIEKFQQSSLPLAVSVQQQPSMMFDQGGSNASSNAYHYQQDDASTNITPRAQSVDKKQENKDALVDTYV